MNLASPDRIRICLAAATFALVAAPSTARPCLEEVAGVCIKYGAPASTKPQAASPEAAAEAGIRMSRDERRRAQEGLRARGFYTGAIDGVFGAGTRRAISRWQEAEGAPPTGYLTLASFRRLLDQPRQAPDDGETTAVASASPPAPAPKPAPPETFVAVAPPLDAAAPPAATPPAAAPPAAAPREAHPVAGRVYSHEYDMASIARYTIAVEREDAAHARIRLIVDNGDQGFRKSCVVALAGPFECYLAGRGWTPRRIFGVLPEVQLDLAAGAPGGNRHRFWD